MSVSGERNRMSTALHKLSTIELANTVFHVVSRILLTACVNTVTGMLILLMYFHIVPNSQ